MVETPGLCTQTGQCENATKARLIAVPLGAPFVCPACGHGLTAPVQQTPLPVRRMSPVLPVGLACAAALVVGGAMLLGRQLGTTGALPAAPAPAASRTASLPVVVAVSSAPAPIPAPAKPDPVQGAPANPTLAARSAPIPVTNPAKPEPHPVAATAALPVAPADTVPVMPTSPAQMATVRSQAAISSTPSPALTTPIPTPTTLAQAPQAATPATLPPDPPPVADPPFNPVPLSGGAPAYPVSLAADGRPGRVAVTCVIAIDGRPQACRAGAVKGGPAFSTAALAWLDHGHVRFRPMTAHGRPVAGTRSWVIAIEEPATALAEARRKAHDDQIALAEPPQTAADPSPRALPAPADASSAARVATHPASVQRISARQVLPSATRLDRPFSTHVLRGGMPTFPVVYDESRPGEVTVRCTILTDGAPRDCSVLRQTGGSAFGESVQTWLRSGRVRFAPIVSDGQPVSRVQTWTVTFAPPA